MTELEVLKRALNALQRELELHFISFLLGNVDLLVIGVVTCVKGV